MKKSFEQDMEWEKQGYMQPRMTAGQLEQLRQTIARAKRDRQRKRRPYRIVSASAAAAAAVFVVLPNVSADAADAMGRLPFIGGLVDVITVRDYTYEDEKNSADIKVPQVVVSPTDDANDGVTKRMEQSAGQLNEEIAAITDRLIAEFKDNLSAKGYQDMVVKSEVIKTTQDYFTLKLICYQAAGSGSEQDYFYTIDLKSGERLKLSDLFRAGSDYLTPISENIREQMRAQMAEDDMVSYWLDDPEVGEWNFKGVTDADAFYVNANGELVISFDEGEVAPMYMGVVTFTIPKEVLAHIWK